MKRLYLITGWTIFALGTVVANALTLNLLFSRSSQPTLLTTQREVKLALSTSDGTTSSSGEVLGLETAVQPGDARPAIVADFLSRHTSPLQPYDEWGKKLVDVADKYGIDFRLLPAIAMQESNLCKTSDPAIHNCLGFGIHKRGTLGFDTYEAGFDRAARELKKNYIDEGRTTPELIMEKYTPSSDGSWANSVNQWISEMRYNDYQVGKDKKVNADITEFVAPTATPSSSP